MAETYPVNLQRDEEVVAVFRPHPATVIVNMAGTAIVAILILIVLILLRRSDILNFLDWLWNLLIVVVIVGALISLVLDYFRYHNDIWMITNQRIIDMARRNPFRQDVSTAALVNIQDMSISRRGVLATMFKFGDVTCQTASQGSQFVFKGVADPDKVLDMVDEQRALIRKQGSQPTSTQTTATDTPVESAKSEAEIPPEPTEMIESDNE